MPIMIHPELPAGQYFDAADSAVPQLRASGWRTASDEDAAEFREETQLIRVPLPETRTADEPGATTTADSDTAGSQHGTTNTADEGKE